MASGRFTGRGSSRGKGSGNDALRRLAELGEGSTRSTDERDARVANEAGLRALGDRMAGADAPAVPAAPERTGRRGHRRRRRRWSRRRKIFTVLGVVLVLVVGVVGAGYAYLQYEWGKVNKVACTSCAVVTSSLSPFNVLLIGSDTRVGNTGQAAKSFGTTADSGGQHSDTIKILHVDPRSGTATLLSIPRDTWVDVTGLPQSTGLDGPEKINASFNDTVDPAEGPDVLAETIEDTFGIPISHFIVVDFIGFINAVSAVGGIQMNIPYPVRDCSEDGCSVDNSGLAITQTGCQTLNGNEALALARSRYFEYDDPATGGWQSDPTSDLGRIQRQDEIIDALMSKVESTYNPLTLHTFIDSVVNDITIDKGLSEGLLFDLATKYHAFSPSKLQTLTLPTSAASNEGGDVEIVEEPQAEQMITQFLGTTPNTPTTPPLDADDEPLSVPTVPASTPGSSAAGPSPTATSAPPTTSTTLPPYDPTPC